MLFVYFSHLKHTIDLSFGSSKAKEKKDTWDISEKSRRGGIKYYATFTHKEADEIPHRANFTQHSGSDITYATHSLSSIFYSAVQHPCYLTWLWCVTEYIRGSRLATAIEDNVPLLSIAAGLLPLTTAWTCGGSASQGRQPCECSSGASRGTLPSKCDCRRGASDAVTESKLSKAKHDAKRATSSSRNVAVHNIDDNLLRTVDQCSCQETHRCFVLFYLHYVTLSVLRTK